MPKTILITGASRGIGAALAIELSKKGYNIIINYLQNHDLAQQVANECRGEQCSPTQIATIHQADIRDFLQVQNMINQIGTIDILINNAGIMQQKLFIDLTEEDWDNMFATNTKGTFNCIKSVLPQMLSRNSGQIINITSIHGETPAACESHYSASKAAIIALTNSLSEELKETNIKISQIPLPGVDTDMQKKLKQDYKEMTGFEYVETQKLLTPQEAANIIISNAKL